MKLHVERDPQIPLRLMAQLLFDQFPDGSVVHMVGVHYDRWRRRLKGGRTSESSGALPACLGLCSLVGRS
jgi:hypothetical protein